MIRQEIKNKYKIINDPVFGFIQIPHDLLFELIEHPIVQRLKRIKQLGLSSYVFPGAQHTRFQHALGAMHLMNEAIQTLRSKGHDISHEEELGALVAILLHDIGHSPFSHVLEQSLVKVSHEEVSLLLMRKLNLEFGGQLTLAIEIFQGRYAKKYLHQLVSGQLDMDRLDYLRRDSFFTGVTEGTIGSARLIKMLNVKNDHLVVDIKGIYSVEKFLISRRLMYWQVYLHKTALAAERMMVNVFQRANELSAKGDRLFATEPLAYFLNNTISKQDLIDNPANLDYYINLDDSDIITSLKAWENHKDIILSALSNGLIDRKLYKIEFHSHKIDKATISNLIDHYCSRYPISKKEASYFIFASSISTNMYDQEDEEIKILYKTGKVENISEASDVFNKAFLGRVTKKYFMCYMQST